MARFRPISDAAFERAQEKADSDATPYVVGACYDPPADLIEIVLNTGAIVSFASTYIPELSGASEHELGDLTLDGGGTVISFPVMDVYLSVAPLLEQFFGPMEWGRRERRAAASRENGKKGGRPPKNPEKEATNRKIPQHV